MQFNDLLEAEGIDPKDVLVFRHRPKELKLRKVLPWLAEENHTLFNAYQQTQGPKTEKAMKTRAKFVAAFVGNEPGKAVFVGLYKVGKTTPLSFDQFWQVPANLELRGKYGLTGMTDKRFKTLWFDLALLDFRSEWKGKLVVCWPGMELSFWRWANNNEFLVHSIAEDSIFDRRMPEWNQLILCWNELGILPRKWREELSRWRGIYFLLEESDGKGYVGAAYGDENLYQRWCKGYAKSGHGGNKKLKRRDPECFRFSILQILPHDMKETTFNSSKRRGKIVCIRVSSG